MASCRVEHCSKKILEGLAAQILGAHSNDSKNTPAREREFRI